MNWPLITAGEFMVKRGGSVNPAKYPDEVFDLLSIPAFDRGEVDVLPGSEIGSSKSCVQENDVLLSKIIPHTRRCWVVPKANKRRQIGSGEWIIFRSKEFDPNFLKHFLTSNIFHRQFMNTVAGMGGSLVRARPAAVEKIKIPFPPLEEQKRIAAILDKADSIRRKRQQSIELADQLLRSVFLDMFGDPVTNPKGWKIKPIGDWIRNGAITEVQDGNHGSVHPKVSDFVDEGYPFVAANCVRNGKILFDKCYYLDEAWLTKLRIGFAKPADVLLTHKGTLGQVAILTAQFPTYIFSPQTTYYRLNEDRVSQHYLANYFKTDHFQRTLVRVGKQSTRAYVGITRQKELLLPLPPIDIQRAFSKICIEIQELSSKIKTADSSQDLLLESLSQNAFNEKLGHTKIAYST